MCQCALESPALRQPWRVRRHAEEGLDWRQLKWTQRRTGEARLVAIMVGGGGPGWGWARPAIIAGDLRDSCRGGGAHGREADAVKAEGAARTGGPHVG
jgi:hypothetical protein